ncbi:MAG: glycosyltransferase, partial [Armatimonadota bacterium]|nr:glycosyltransferase [Armatimonadota bacterium]
MRVSIIVPAFNAEKYLPETVEGALAQTLSDWEMVI